ncbi:MAG: hypothetical protein ACOC58_00055 [Chloroflexota bacterium]
MRNQTWTQDGMLIRDIELYADGSKVKARDHLAGQVRDADDEEREIFLATPIDWRAEWQAARPPNLPPWAAVLARRLGIED